MEIGNKDNDKELEQKVETEQKVDDYKAVYNQEQKVEEKSSMFGDNDFLADNRNSDSAFDRGFAQFADDWDNDKSTVKNAFNDIVDSVKEKWENEKERESRIENASELNEIKDNNIEITQEMRDAQKESENLAREGQKDNDTEYAYSDKKETASELFEQRDDLTKQLEAEKENPVNGTFEIEEKLDIVNEKISNLSNEEIKDYNNSLSPEITEDMRAEQKESENLAKEGQKDNDTSYDFDNLKQEALNETKADLSADVEQTVNSLEKLEYEARENDQRRDEVKEPEQELGTKIEVSTETTNQNETTTENSAVSSTNETKADLTADSNEANALKQEFAKMEFDEYADKNIAEADRKDFTDFMSLDNEKLNDLKNLSDVESYINNKLESFSNNDNNIQQDFELYKDAVKETNAENSASSTVETESTVSTETSNQKETTVSNSNDANNNANSDITFSKQEQGASV